MTKAKALTETQWLSATEPYVLLRHLQQHLVITRVPGGRRRLRLFCCACCRQVWQLLDDGGRRAVEVSEQFAEGLVRKATLMSVWRQAQAARRVAEERRLRDAIDRGAGRPRHEVIELNRAYFLAIAAEYTAAPRFAIQSAQIVSMNTAAAAARSPDGPGPQALQANGAGQCDLLRDIFGNPFRPVAVGPAWLTWNNGLVRSLARTMSDGGDFRGMPVLADALEEAGCASEDILHHCRRPGEHMRGCWVVDLLLGKE
jgi:hypothetical protein